MTGGGVDDLHTQAPCDAENPPDSPLGSPSSICPKDLAGQGGVSRSRLAP